MKVEKRTKTVEYNVYISDDGTEYNNSKDCKHHDRLVHGEIKECPECHGKGQVPEEFEYDNYHTGAPEKTTIYPTCKKCNGKGYLEKKTKTVWE